MNSFIETLNQRGGNFLSFAWPMLWQSSLLIAVLFAFDLLLRRKLRACIRYALWLVILVKLCVPPALALPTSPAWWLNKMSPPIVAKPDAMHYSITYDNVPLPEIPQALLPAFATAKPGLSFAAWLLAISAGISLTLLIWLLVRWRQITRQVRRARTSERLATLADEAQKSVGMKFKLQVKLTSNSMSPAVCGLFRPAILIPQSLAEHFSDEQLRAVLLHELIHLRRRDVWVNFLQALLQIFYWWHPLVWLANAHIRRVREEAVDDAVMLALRDEAESYAPTLLEVARLALNRPLVSLGLVGIMESRHALRQRIERLVDFRPPRTAGLTLVSLLGILAFTAVAVPMGGAPEQTNNPTLPGGGNNLSQTNSSVSTTTNFSSGTNSIEEKMKAANRLVQDGKLLYEMGKFAEAEVKLNAALSLDSENAAARYYLGLVQAARQTQEVIKTSEGRQTIMQKLKIIRLDRVAFDAVPLGEIIGTLSVESKKNDPDRRGINYLLNPHPKTDPGTGLPVAINDVPAADLLSLPITISPALINITLADALDALVKAAPEPIHYSVEDYAIVFSPGKPAEPFYARTFKVDTNTFYNGLKNATGLQTNNISMMAGKYFKTLGVDLTAPGKSIFFNYRLGMLIVRATGQDLDAIERAIELLNLSAPQVHIKARFVEVTQEDSKVSGVDWYLGHFGSNDVAVKVGSSPSPATPVSTYNSTGVFPGNTTSSPGGLQNSSPAIASVTGILTDTNSRLVLHAMQQRGKSEILCEPEVTTISGRRTIMKETTKNTVITNFTYQETATNSGIIPQFENAEFGSVLDSTALVLSDGYTIDLNLKATYSEFLGYDKTTNTTTHYTKAGVKINVPTSSPRIETRQASKHINVWDGQTVVLGGMIIPSIQTTKEKVPLLGDLPGIGRLFQSQSKTEIKRNLMVFVTVTLVDSGGKRIHSDEEIPFPKDGIPAQPPK
jgi:type II secretory pathway component GspD/PulD (secretin)/beta-lactamase regulating signal transducer with metallopeptidase domain